MSPYRDKIINASQSEIQELRSQLLVIGTSAYAKFIKTTKQSLLSWLKQNPYWQPFSIDELKSFSSRSSVKRWSQPDAHEHHSSVMQAKWLEPGYSERTGVHISESKSTPEASNHQSEIIKAKYADPVYKAKHTASMRTVWDDPAYRKRLSESLKKSSASEKARASRAKASLEFWSHEDYRIEHDMSDYSCRHLTVSDLSLIEKEYPEKGFECLYSFFPKIDPANSLAWKHVRSSIKRVHGIALYCERYASNAERSLALFIQSLGFECVHVVRGHPLNPISKELDCYLPGKRIAFELNGLYWHSNFVWGSRARNLQQIKTDLCREQGVSLYHIWEDDWVYKTDVVKSCIKSKLGVFDSVVYARNTTVSQIDSKMARDFLDKYHIQGKASASSYYGLFDNGFNLIAVAAVLSTTAGFVLVRYATSCHIPGGFSKLLSYLPHGHYISFADTSISDGGLYLRTGWTLDSILLPDYMYVYNRKRVHKFNFRLDRFKSDFGLVYQEGLTEFQLADLNKIPRVYGCKKLRFVLDK